MTTTAHLQVVPRTVAPPASVEHAGVVGLSWARQLKPGRRVAPVLIELVAAQACAATVHVAVGPLPIAVVAAAPVVWVLALTLCGGYRVVPGAGRTRKTRPVARAALVVGLAWWVFAALSPGVLATGSAANSRTALLLTAVVSAASLVLRLGTASGSRAISRRVVIVGDAEGVEEALREIRRATDTGAASVEPVAVCVTGAAPFDQPGAESGSGLPRLGVQHGTEQLLAAVTNHRADAVIVVPGSWADHEELRRIGWQLQGAGTPLMVSYGLLDVAPQRLDLTAVGGMGLLHVRPAPLAGPTRLVKDVVDGVVAAVLLVLLAPVLAVLTFLIRADSPGPAVFRQERVGRQGRIFTMYKLRTMTTDAERIIGTLADVNESDRTGVLFKIRSDPRITKVGAILRRYSLDELPQLVNVLRGEMSLVGPRPALPSEVSSYDNDVRRRLEVKPGLTGLWQVSGRSDLSWEETVRLDLQYVDNWSWGLDAAITLRTASAVLSHRGAY